MSLRDYFSNNKIFTGTEKPTQGKFDVGDIIVNIGPNSAEEPMWICVEAGTPGVWELCSGVNEEEITNIIQSNALTAVEYTDGVDIQIDGGEIGNMNELQTTDKSSIVGAINELFQSANNGKELIASAIGEPLDSNDTFSAMSNDINSLLSQFKTNMMNSGVTVESNDRFKQLIDKIKGLTEGEGNKGIQYAEGTCSLTHTIDSSVDHNLVTDLAFTPTIAFVTFEGGRCFVGSFSEVATISNYYFDESNPFVFLFEPMNQFKLNTYMKIIDNGVQLHISTNLGYSNQNGIFNVKWYAIGVGEEDTTLRDSLASILQGEGVEVTEEDDMASLISKVDEEFENKNTEMESNKGLDIISATELPATGRENQICVITDNPDNKIVFVTNLNDIDHSTNNIYIYLGTSEANAYNTGKTYDCDSGNFTFKLYIVKIYQNSKNLASYIYQNGTWVEYTYDYIYFIENSVLTNSEIFGTLVSGNAMKATSAPAVYICSPSDSGGYPYHIATTNKQIDFSLYNYIEVVGYHQSSSGSITMMCYDSTRNGHYGSYVSNIHYADPVESFTTTSSVVTYDIRSWTSTGYLGFSYTTQDGSQYIYITDVRLR